MEQFISQWTIAREDIKTEFRKNYGMNYVSDFICQQMMPKLLSLKIVGRGDKRFCMYYKTFLMESTFKIIHSHFYVNN